MAIGPPLPCCMLHLYMYINITIAGGIIIYLSAYTCLCTYLRSTICTGVISQLIVTLTGARDTGLDQRGQFSPLRIVYCVMVALSMSTSPACMHVCHCVCITRA